MIRYGSIAIVLIIFVAAFTPLLVFQGGFSLDVPFFSQTALRDQRVSSGAPLTLGNSDRPLWEYGCGVASLAMVYSYYGVDTDIVRLNEALRQTDGFSDALLAWDRANAFRRAGAPWIQGLEQVNTARPRDYQKRVDEELAAGHPVIAYLGNRHYVVLVGKDGKGNYLINDPWKLTAADGQGIALEQNDLKLKFDDIRQFVFLYPDRNAPTNGVPVSGAIAEKYFTWGGARGSLGNPTGPAGATSDGGQYQIFERGAILAVQEGVYALQGPVWEKYLAEGLSRQTTTTADTERPLLAPGGRIALGWPRGDSYSYFVGPAVEWRADFADGFIVWTERDRPQNARVLTAANAIRAEYFANADLAGRPAYVRFEEDLLFDWREGAPGLWVNTDGFSARYGTTFHVGSPLGWWYNFVVDADEGVRVKVDGETVLDAWTGGAGVHQFTHRLGRGQHTLLIEYREVSGKAWLRAAWSAWPAEPVFAAEEAVGPIEWLPTSVAESVPDLATPIAQATATAQAVGNGEDKDIVCGQWEITDRWVRFAYYPWSIENFWEYTGFFQREAENGQYAVLYNPWIQNGELKGFAYMKIVNGCPSSISALPSYLERNPICGRFWAPRAGDPGFTGVYEPLFEPWGTEDIIDLMFLEVESADIIRGLDRGAYINIYDPEFAYPGFLGNFSRIERVDSCESVLHPESWTQPISLSTTVEVFASKGWQDTGIQLQPGDRVMIEYISGKWTNWVSHNAPYGADGPPTTYICAEFMSADKCLEPVPDFPAGALVGRVGQQLLGIGDHLAFTVESAGNLELRINDGDEGLGDNAGSIIVRITV